MNADGGPGDAGAADDAGGATAGTDDRHSNAAKEVVAVTADDEATGVVNRLEAHTGNGTRHRAFTLLLFDDHGNVLLAQRSPDKRLWDTHWDGTVASHPTPDESQEEAARARLVDELGVTPDQYDDLRVTDRFEYKRYYERAGVEHEVCAVLQATLDDTTIEPNPDEVAGLLWAPYDRLQVHPEQYRQLRLCPWFEIAMRRDSD